MAVRTRMIGVATISLLLIIFSFNYLNVLEITDYLPQPAHGHSPAEIPLDSEAGKTHDPSVSPPKGKPIEDEHHTDLDYLLEEFLQRPVQSYDEAVSSNTAACPVHGVNYDRNGVDGNVEKWKDIPSSQISEWRQGIVMYLQKKQREHHSKKASTEDGGRGIVMAAGDHNAVIRAQTSINFLKSYNCTLPVEIFHFSSELSGTDKAFLKDLSQLGDGEGAEGKGMKVTVRVVEGLEKGHGWKDFHIKGAAIQQTSFSEILYLDTDSYLLRDPTYLFEGPQWSKTGLLLWPDYSKSHATNPIWRLLGQKCRNEYEGESGQIIISRTRHQDLLWLVEYFALHHEEYYGFMGGDRDSFRAAALLLGKKWAGPGRLNAAAGVALPNDPQGGGHTMLQADPEGKWMFVHANLIKHGSFPKPLWTRIHRATNDRYVEGTTYGNIEPPNDRIGEGVKLHVFADPKLVTEMSVFEGFDQGLVTVDDWDSYEELKGFEEKWFAFGGVH
ncbi:glycosyltransferase family 71 protein [Rutstroemia sp. NJR-2017a BVV2]|nr:glycosyltransferase family 71 protein [Rutstroemia sp. NJR-2017a BVV2]